MDVIAEFTLRRLRGIEREVLLEMAQQMHGLLIGDKG
jgi:hypothetical protein